jgi:hypothetical protein
MSYSVPAYTEISHFRAPYKNSFMGFGAARSDSSASSPSANRAPGIKIDARGLRAKRSPIKQIGTPKRQTPQKKGSTFTFSDSGGGSTSGGGGGSTSADDQLACPENAVQGSSGNCECIEGFAPDAAGETCVKSAPASNQPPASNPPPEPEKAGMSSAVPYIVGAGILGALAWLAMSPKKAG